MMITNQRPVTVLFSSYQSNLSGAPRSLFHIVNEIDKTRFDCHVLFTNNGPIVAEFKAISNIHILAPFETKRLPAGVKLKIRDYQFQRDIQKLLQQVRPDLFYLNTIGENLVSSYALSSAIPTIVHYHEIENTVMSLADKWLQKLRQAHLSIGCAQAVSDFIVRCLCIPAGKVCTIPESIPIHRITEQVTQTRKQLLDNLGVPENAVVLGTVGKPSFRKGADLFLEAARIIQEIRPREEVYFVWVGGNEQVQNTLFMTCMKQNVLDYGLSDKFHWVTEVHSAASWIAAFDAYVVSSREDPLPLGMLEAMALGKPMVGFAVSGVPEAIGNTGGELVDSVSAEHLAQGILNLLSKQDRWLEIGKITQQKAAAKFDISKNINKIEETIFNLIQVAV